MTWLIKRNCSASPRQLAIVLGSLVAVSFAIGAVFAALGFWMVLPFVGLEVVAMMAAFLLYGRHAADAERIALSDGTLLVERIEANQSSRWEFDPAWVRVEVDEQGKALGRRVRVHLAQRGGRVEVGRYLLDERRWELASELRNALAATQGPAGLADRRESV
jgi:uncharacterized membrane protein